MAICLSPSSSLASRLRRHADAVARALARLSPLLLLPAGLACAAEPVDAPSRGELLYATHCITCHSEQMHWRDQRAATDWTSLNFQVRRWQAAASLGWTDADILEVARHLNDRIYRFTPVGDKQSSRPADLLAARGR